MSKAASSTSFPFSITLSFASSSFFLVICEGGRIMEIRKMEKEKEQK